MRVDNEQDEILYKGGLTKIINEKTNISKEEKNSKLPYFQIAFCTSLSKIKKIP